MPVNRSLESFAEHLAEHQEGFADLFHRMGYLVLLPLLEFPYAEVQDRLIPSFVAAGIAKDDGLMISLRQLIVFAIEQGSPYWGGLAVDWIEAGFHLDRELVEVVDRRIGNRNDWPQKLRHHAYKLVRRWQRQQGETNSP